jgi:hypothetical protein
MEKEKGYQKNNISVVVEVVREKELEVWRRRKRKK